MPLAEELERVAEAAGRFASPGEELGAVIPTEPAEGLRLYVCGYRADGRRSWLVLDAEGRPVRDRALVRDAVSIAAMCEIAGESAGGGDLPGLRARLRELRETDAPDGVEEAEAAAEALQDVLDAAPRIASPSYLDVVGSATRRLEQTLSAAETHSPFAETMKASLGSVEELNLDVEANYKAELL